MAGGQPSAAAAAAPPLARGSSSAAPIELSDSENGDGENAAVPTAERKRRVSAMNTSNTPPSAPSGKRRKQKASAAAAPATVARRAGLLQDRRVLIVPIGADVSRKRVAVWQEMVERLGGRPVAAPNASDELDWRTVDVVVASAHLERQKAREFYRAGAFPPADAAARVRVYTPEWLAFLLRERRFPGHDDAFAWTFLREQLEAEQQHREEVEAARAADGGGEENDSLATDEGSDIRLRGTQEIERTPPVALDAEKLRREEAELQALKDALVEERTPIFFANNPGFRSIVDEPDGKPMRAEAFVCQKSSMMQANLNAHLTDPLEELMEYLHVERDIWREFMYKKAVSSLKAMRTRISSVRGMKGLSWAKGRLRNKIVEVLETGKIEKLEAKKTNPRLRCLVEMSRIWGVGPATATKLYNLGYKTLDDLRKNGASVLSEQQQIGLKHYDDFLTKIPRAEVTQIEKTVVDAVHSMIPNATALSCGSYRRGKLSSGDCDVLITDPDNEECDILPELLKRLHATGFLTDDLTHISEHHMGGCDTYMGVCRVSEDLPHRRLDIKVYPRRCFGFALLYFTGSDHFNRSMRLFANKKGWSLSDRELKPVARVNGKKVARGESVVCSSEVDVFIALGMEYKDPRERNCFDIKFLDEDEARAKHEKSGAAQSSDAATASAAGD